LKSARRNGWKVLECTSVKPVFPDKERTINYAVKIAQQSDHHFILEIPRSVHFEILTNFSSLWCTADRNEINLEQLSAT
jgi:hypothetical protein